MITVFYGQQVFGSFIAWNELRMHMKPGDPVYEEGYAYNPNNNRTHKNDMPSWPEWYRCDGTPLHIDDIPKTLRMLQLVLNL